MRKRNGKQNHELFLVSIDELWEVFNAGSQVESDGEDSLISAFTLCFGSILLKDWATKREIRVDRFNQVQTRKEKKEKKFAATTDGI